MQFKKYFKQRNGSIQGLRSLKDTLPTNIKKVINKRGQIYSEILNNWKYIAGEKFSYADIQTSTTLKYLVRLNKLELSNWVALNEYVDSLMKRPSFNI